VVTDVDTRRQFFHDPLPCGGDVQRGSPILREAFPDTALVGITRWQVLAVYVGLHVSASACYSLEADAIRAATHAELNQEVDLQAFGRVIAVREVDSTFAAQELGDNSSHFGPRGFDVVGVPDELDGPSVTQLDLIG